jgi:hypothetical protein
MRWIFSIALISILALVPGPSVWTAEVSKEQIKGLDEQVQDVKTDVLNIAAELSRLEEKLLYPSDTQVSLFVSIAEGEKFRLDAVQIQIDGKDVAHHLYTFKELEALQQGGRQRIYTGNIRTGEHDVKVSLIGKSESGSEYRESASFTINKDVGPKLVEISLAGPGSSKRSIDYRDW